MDASAATAALSVRFKSDFRLFFAVFSFGFFQALMPFLGYLLGKPFSAIIAPIDHWVAFVILGGLGVHTLWNFYRGHEDELILSHSEKKLGFRLIFSLALATSIDAFVVGIGFSALQWNLFTSLICIGLVTWLTCALALYAGKQFEKRFSDVAEQVGAWVLIALGFKILITHLFF